MCAYDRDVRSYVPDELVRRPKQEGDVLRLSRDQHLRERRCALRICFDAEDALREGNVEEKRLTCGVPIDSPGYLSPSIEAIAEAE
jgi:hypothetical protein